MIASAISTGFYGFCVAVGYILGAALFCGVSWLVIYFVGKFWGDKNV